MATDDWPIPEDDATEAADTPETVPRPETEAEADEADTLEQAQEVPEDDEYRDA